MQAETFSVPAHMAHAHEMVRRVGEPLLGGNQADLFCDGGSAHQALMNTLERAREHINLDDALLVAPDTRAELVAALMAARRNGARVHMRTNADATLLHGELSQLNSAGVTLSVSQPRRAWRQTLAARTRCVQRQLAVVDGRVAWIGPGVKGIGALHQGLHVQVKGPVVQHLQRLFLESWRASSPRVALPRGHYFPPIALAGHQRMVLSSGVPSSAIEAPRTGHALLGAASVARHSMAVTLSSTVACNELVQPLIDAAARGVQVSVLVPHGAALSLLWRARTDAWLRAGVRVVQNEHEHLRASICVVDDVWSSIAFGAQDDRPPQRGLADAELLILDRDTARFLRGLFQLQCAGATALQAGGAATAPLSWLHWAQRASALMR